MKEEANYDYMLPNLKIENKKYEQINKYGYLKLNYINEYKKTLYHERLIKNDKKLTEKNKEINQMEWVKLMINYIIQRINLCLIFVLASSESALLEQVLYVVTQPQSPN